MKRIRCILLVLLLSFGIYGCQEAENTLQPLSPNEKNTVNLERTFMLGEIISKMSPNVLVLKTTGSNAAIWGETVYVITDNADELCVNDIVEVTYCTAELPHDTTQYARILADEVKIYNPGDLVAKPILYFYPEKATVCSAKVTLKGELTCTYPAHGTAGWINFTANPDGKLIFPDGKAYYALYWEGIQSNQWDFSQGYCVRGEDTAAFLEWALAEQGLTAREANEFIIYWLPLMQDNPYNVISFQSSAYTDSAVLDISPAPDSLLRVFMAYYPTQEAVDIQPQAFAPFVREGFTVVEWGGSQVK